MDSLFDCCGHREEEEKDGDWVSLDSKHYAFTRNTLPHASPDSLPVFPARASHCGTPHDTHCGPGTVLCMRRGIAVDGGRANARLAAALHQVPAGGPYSKCGTRRPARVAILSFFFNHSHSLLLFLRPRSATKTVYREGKESPPRPICLKGPCVFPDGFCPHQNKCFTCDGPLDCGECGIRARKWKASDNSLTRRQRTFKGWFSFFDRTAAAEEPGKRCPFEGIHCRHPVAFCPHAMRCFSCDDWSCEDCGVTTFPAEAGAEKKPIPLEPV